MEDIYVCPKASK